MTGDLAYLGNQQPEVVGDLRGRADRRATGTRCILMRDRNRWRDPVNSLGIRFFQPLKVLPSVRGKALNVAALALGVERVECQTGLTAATDPAHHNELLVWNVQIHALEIVDGDATQFYSSRRQGSSLPQWAVSGM